MKAKLAAVIITISLLLSAGITQAADKTELARQYFNLFNLEKTIKVAFSNVAAQSMIQAMKQAEPDKEIRQEEIAAKYKSLREAYTQPEYLRQVNEEGIKTIAEVFTEDELKALVHFYSSKEGQSVLQKTPILMREFQKKITKMSVLMVKKYLENRSMKREAR